MLPSSDLLNLANPTDVVVISTLTERFQNGEIYTWLGDNILVSLNPNREIPNLYSLDVRIATSQTRGFRVRPHVYTLTEKCLRQLSVLGKNQSVIITGTSGSGKTEAAKHIIQYLVFRSSSKQQKERCSQEAEIERIILHSNPILEALGNAQTCHNENSSRFGKYMRLIYNQDHILVGAKIQVYLLEKTRSIFTDHLSLCSSFHIFRWFINTLSDFDPNYFHIYLESCPEQSQTQTQWDKLTKELASLAFLGPRLEQLRNLLAAILLLNSVRFVSTNHDNIKSQSSLRQSHVAKRAHENKPIFSDELTDLAAIHPDDISKVTLAGRLLGISTDDDEDMLDHFAKQLLTRRVQAGGSSTNSFRMRRLTEYACACNILQAREQRDCLIKSLYSSLFHYFVDLINERLTPSSSVSAAYEFGILDMFGFECLDLNSFEQFCINYANERLHQTFMRIAVTSVRAELEAECVLPIFDLKDPNGHLQTTNSLDQAVRSCDNHGTLMALKTAYNILDEVCLLNRVHNAGTNASDNSSELLDPRELDWLRRMQTTLAPDGPILVKGSTEPTTPVSRILKKANSMTPVQSFKNLVNRPKPASPTRPRLPAFGSFTVRHYANPVTYSAHGFVSKNLDRLPVHLLNWLSESTCNSSNSQSPVNFIQDIIARTAKSANQQMCNAPPQTPQSPSTRSPMYPLNKNSMTSHFEERPTTPKHSLSFSKENATPSLSSGRKHNSRRLNTVFGNFKSSLDELLELLGSHKLVFVRCIRPNLSVSSVSPTIPNPFDLANNDTGGPEGARKDQIITCVSTAYVRDQLLSGGLLAALTVLRSTFSTRYTYEDFISRYQIFWRLSPNAPAKQLHNLQFSSLTKRYLQLIDLSRTPSKRSSAVLRRETGESVIQQQQQVVFLLLSLGLNFFPSPDKPLSNSESFPLISQFGLTRIHLTSAQSEHLENLRHTMLNSAARIIQRNFKRFHNRLSAVRRIQFWWRHRAQNRKLVTPALSEQVNCNIDLETLTDSSDCSNSVSSRYQVVCSDLPMYELNIMSRRRLPVIIYPTSKWQYRESDVINILIPYARRKVRPYPLQIQFQSPQGLLDVF